ncbi:MAG: DAK2 domain-containing protein [Lachnospiraceae bacterium]|nr:DAK2 domain-containing protein [Lachnospiraceae bacterium]
MAVNTIDAQLLSKMFLAGAKNLDSKKDWINELNVFPVPDGDTGTNMTMTIMSAAKEVVAVDSSDMTAVCKAMSSGSLKGARGNSGVILSQLIRGFTKIVKTKELLTQSDISEAFDKAVETAYKAVMKPKEGTILTVAKAGADKAKEMAEKNVSMEEMVDEIIKYMDEVLDRTPDMLPILKQAGVVDSGGQGLMQLLKGAQDVFLGKEVDLSLNEEDTSESKGEGAEEITKYLYETHFIVRLDKDMIFSSKAEKDFKAFLETISDQPEVSVSEDFVKVYMNTDDPGMAIQKGIQYGDLATVSIRNRNIKSEEIEKMEAAAPAEQTSEEDELANMEHKDTAVIAVSVGEGIKEIFKSLGVDYVISGGQTMNPSTEDMLNAIAKLNADNIIILPNNKNIILAANQAQSLTKDKNIFVVPTKTVPQGISAVINFVPDMSAQENADAMADAISVVRSGEVTYAIRDTMIEDKTIKQGDFMGIGDKGIRAVGPDKDAVTRELLEDMVDEEVELISIYYGQDVSEEEASKLADEVRSKFSGCDVELQYGGQPIYYYLLSAE